MSTTNNHTMKSATAADFAGHCNESAAWQILKEISGQLIEHKQRIVNPFLISIGDDGHFNLMPSETQQASYDAPEIGTTTRTESATVWSMGAVLYFLVMGREVMNGKGGPGQSRTSKLPYMRSEWPALSELVQRCLQYAPNSRPSLQEIHDIAAQNLERCRNDIKHGPKFKPAKQAQTNGANPTETELAFWPETMKYSNK